MQVELTQANVKKLHDLKVEMQRNTPTYNSYPTFIVNQILSANLDELIKSEREKSKGIKC